MKDNKIRDEIAYFITIVSLCAIIFITLPQLYKKDPPITPAQITNNGIVTAEETIIESETSNTEPVTITKPPSTEVFPAGGRLIRLSEVAVVDFYEYTYINKGFTDFWGNIYDEAFWFKPDCVDGYQDNKKWDTYAVFNLNAEYTKFSVDIVVPKGISETANFKVEIRFDDSDVPEKTVRNFNVTKGRQTVELDVPNVEKMKITVLGSNSKPTKECDLYLVNAILQK